MIQPYITQIQTLYISHIEHYKQNLRLSKGLDEKLETLEHFFANKFSKNLKTFLNWSCTMPIWKAPFLPFVKNGKDFYLWAHTARVIKIYLDQSAKDTKKKLEIMNGHFLMNNKEEYIYKVYVDVDASYTDTKEAVFLEYGRVKPDYSDQFENQDEVVQIVLANSIEQFCHGYLNYLKKIPIKKKAFKKIDKLLESPKKLFEYVSKYNWDYGEDEIEYIINSNKCDKATALFIYWLSRPYYYDEKIGSEMKMIPFVIEGNFKKNFYIDSENQFDPQSNPFANFIKEYEGAKDRKREIPEYMLGIVA